LNIHFFYIMNPCSKFWKQTRERVDLSSKFSKRKGKKRIKENKAQTVTDFLTLVDPIRFQFYLRWVGINLSLWFVVPIMYFLPIAHEFSPFDTSLGPICWGLCCCWKDSDLVWFVGIYGIDFVFWRILVFICSWGSWFLIFFLLWSEWVMRGRKLGFMAMCVRLANDWGLSVSDN